MASIVVLSRELNKYSAAFQIFETILKRLLRNPKKQSRITYPSLFSSICFEPVKGYMISDPLHADDLVAVQLHNRVVG